MTIKSKLRRYVSDAPRLSKGTVTKITDTSIYVSSSAGLKELRVDSTVGFKRGDTVRFQGENYLGRVPAASGNRVYVV